jgi:hypothetical protein
MIVLINERKMRTRKVVMNAKKLRKSGGMFFEEAAASAVWQLHFGCSNKS